MAWSERWIIWCCVFFVLWSAARAEFTRTYYRGRRSTGPARDFSRHAVVQPRVFHAREKREITSTREKGGGHIHDLTIGYVADGKEYVLDLRLNRELIPETYFESYQNNGRRVVNRPTGKDVELCQYQGRLRGVPGSWAAISTCHGLSGVIFDGEELHYLERGPDMVEHSVPREEHEGNGLGSHYLYRHSDLITNHTCGYSGTPHHILESKEINRILRYKRDTEIIRGPYNANKHSRYVELVLVVDNAEYKKMEENLGAVYHHCKEIANIINSLYVPLNIFIALVGVVVWTDNNEITLSPNGDQTLQNFLQYRRNKLVKEHPNDNAQLLTRVQFDGGVVGKALKGPICTYEFSGGVSTDHSEVVGLVATTVAHEMGHNFGMEHDTSECKCPSDRCIMASSSNSMRPTQWSSCSLEYLALAFEHGMDYCLRNKPKSLFDGPVCGNGFVEAGEQCDCGLQESCDNPCCNAITCMLFNNASCATGECCDLQTCRPKSAGTVCRTADHECDLPEYCTGQSEYCPGDVYKMDGETCDKGKAFCYQGSCRSHSDQCRLLWGPSGKSSDMQCYQMNNKGTRHGNCGYNKLNQSFIKCTDEDVYCGMLHCKHLNERLEFGMESVAILSHSFINSGGSIIPCRTAIVDLGLNEVDPGLAPDGARCGHEKMCVNQRCRSVGSLRIGAEICPENCNGNGVCNSKGHCHCKTGFSPPLCSYPGTGGSQDSGPASDPNARKDVMIAVYVIFLGIVPSVALLALIRVYYTRRHDVKTWWKKSGRTPSHVGASDNQGLPPSKPGEKKAQNRISRGNSMAFRPERNFNNSQGLEISSPLPADVFSSDNAHASLLPKADAANSLNNSSSGNPPSLQSNLFGQFKGFSITPLPSATNASPQPKPPSPPSRNITQNHVAPPVVPNLPTVTKPAILPSKAAAAKSMAITTQNVTSSSNVTSAPNPAPAPSRPLISSPVLDATTSSTAKELIDAGGPPAVPTRPAPQVPSSTSSTLEASNKPTRPVSIPNTLSANAPIAFPENLTEEKKRKDSGGNSYPTLTRLASFMMRSQNPASVARTQSQNQGPIAEKGGKTKGKIVEGTNSLPRKVNKLQIDREALRHLEISNPIPQQEIEIPQKAVPIRAAPPIPTEEQEEEDSSKNVVMRAQSLRGSGPVTQRPAIPTFGSMRQPPGTKRPTSIPTCARPTSPPPRPPPPPTGKPPLDTGIIGMPGYQNPPSNTAQEYCYDDCLNLMPGGSAPLANIDEESSPTIRENIYAVIEESPPEKERRKLGNGTNFPLPMSPKSAPETPPTSKKNKFEYSSPSFNEYKTPKPVDNTVSAGSAESVGLLSEIVNEIQARNMESIYSTSTLGRKKKKDGSTASDDESVSSSVSAQPPTLPDKTSSVAASNSSLGTYVNAPYTSSSIYKPMGSVYSNVSSQNGSSSDGKPSMSSASSSSGYLSPMNMINTKLPANSVIKSPEISAEKNTVGFKPTPFSTATSSIPTPPVSTKPTNKTLDTNTSTNNSYKPYSSSLNRPLGPLASSFRSAGSVPGSAQKKTDVSQPTQQTENLAPKPSKNIPIPSSSSPSTISTTKPIASSTSVAESKIQTKSVLPNKSSLHNNVNPPTVAKPSSTTLPKPNYPDTPKSNSAILNNSTPPKPSFSDTSKTNLVTTLNSAGTGTKVGTNVGKTPDVVSSCAVGDGAGKSPDVVGGGKLDSKIANKQNVETSVNSVNKPSVQSRSGASVNSSVNRTQSTTGFSANKSGANAAGKPTSVHSSFRTGVGKSPQPTPKSFASKSNGETSGSGGGGTPTVPEKKTVGGNAVKDAKNGVGRGNNLTKSASDASSARGMPVGARAAASKLSHVASLQQKFETAATGSDKISSGAARSGANAPSKLKTSSPLGAPHKPSGLSSVKK